MKKRSEKVCFVTLGCKVNQYESESIAKKLKDNGFEVVFGLGEADIYVLSTCAVTNEAERKSRGTIAKILKLNNNARIYVCGCSAQNNPSSFSKFPNVVCVYGTGKKMDLAQIIIDDVSEKLVCSDIDQEYADNFLALPSHTRAYVKIQDGCNNFCSYCIIPYMRGRSRSRTIESIKNELDSLAKSAKEIIFTGINTSAYGVDLSPNNDLTDIIRMARNYPFRFRFSSLEVNVITEKFLEEAKNTKNFCPHFHLSMQSGSDDVLRAMNRHYNSKLFLEKIALIRRYFPNCAITTDVIVGFPTETDKNFEETYATCKRADFADMHIFPFSPRKNTVALNYKNVATNVNERVKRLTELKEQMKRQYLAECEGKEYFVLVEAKESEKGYFEGHTENYIKCYLKGNKAIKPNSVVKVQIIKPMKDGALAEITE